MYEIGPFRLDPHAGVLLHEGRAVALGSRAVAVLAVLVQSPHEFVPKSRIIDAAWPGVIVEEGNLSVQISAIRRVLARVPGGADWIETLARRGYRFVGPVRTASSVEEPPPSLEPHTNVPEALTTFVGREREIARIRKLLPNVRLLTITGAGGIGKTRLATRVAQETASRYREGAWFVDLGPVTDPARVASAVARVLRVREPFSGSLAQTLAAELKGLHALVVLDNCEHLIQACAQLAQTMLEGVWELTILATSREPLAIPGEQVFALSPLALPGAGADVAAVGESEAVRLFVDRAHSHQPDFELTPERSAVVAELCVRLDGIPLALELAAARIRSLSVEQIAARLGDRFRLLTAGSRTALPRHGTLRAALDWSYDLLSGEERSVLRRLAVFSGSFTLESACVVASSDEVDEFAVTDILHQLVSRSLVIADAERVRYRLLETTRAYAREQLAEAGEADALRARHARHYRGFFEGAADAWVRLTDREWSALFEVELDNLRAAFDFASGDLATGLAAASGPVWSTTGLVGEGLRYLEAAALGLDQSTAARDQARIWLWLAMLLDASPARAAAAYERSVALYRRLDDPFWRAYALMRSARVLAEIGRVDDARAVLAESLPVLRESGLPRIVGLHREYEGFVELMVGNAELARRLKEEALGLYRQIGAEALALDALGNLADVIWALGDLDAAVAAFRETLAMLRQSPLSRKRSLGFTLANFAGALVERGDLGEALAAGREGLGYLRDGGYAWIFMDHFAARAAAAGETARAARLGGFAEHAYLSRNAMRQPNEARARTRWQARLRETLDAETMTRLGEEGAAMSEADACALALLPDRPSGVRFPAAGPEVQAGPAREGPTRAGASREMH